MSRAFAGILLLVVACGGGDTWSGRGVVRDVLPEEGQVVIAHEDIAGLMPAMTMNFDVADRTLLANLEPGQQIEFELRRDGPAYQVFAARVIGEGKAGSSGTFEDLAATEEIAPPFELVDQDGVTLRLADLRGQAVVLGFVYTRCPGPCPVLTGIHRDLQRQIPEALRSRTRIVSISLDPAHDNPEVLRAYAKARDIDLSNWSLLTGPPDAVAEVVHSYGVGSLLGQDGEIEHTVVTFLIDPRGHIAQRYLGLSHEPEAMLRALRALL